VHRGAAAVLAPVVDRCREQPGAVPPPAPPRLDDQRGQLDGDLILGRCAGREAHQLGAVERDEHPVLR
jgi:hypothetical protein